MSIIVSEEVAKGLKLIKNGFYNINTLEKAIDNKGGELHLDTKVVFEELSKDEIIKALFYGYEVEDKKLKLEDLELAFRIKRSNGDIYHIVIYGDNAYVAHNETSKSALYNVETVLKYINNGKWILL